MHRLATIIAIVVFVAGCSSPGVTAGPTAAPGSTSPVATPLVTATPVATPDIADPVGIIAMGHSGLTGEGTGGPSQAVPENSWATGSLPAVNSVYLRLAAVRPETQGHVANTAAGGASASRLVGQIADALRQVPVPALAIISTLDNDIQCDGANVADVGKSIANALDAIHTASPNTKILVVGQAGRPRVGFVKLLVAKHPDVKAELTGDDDCSFFDPHGNLQESGFQKLSAVIDRYEAEQARVCALVPNCATDGGTRKAYVDRLENFASDWNHLNMRGQAAEAELIWPVVKQLLGV